MSRIFVAAAPTGHVCNENCPCNQDAQIALLVERALAKHVAQPLTLSRGVLGNAARTSDDNVVLLPPRYVTK